jgi:carbamoyl-phosphate synthase large subunit
MKSTGEVMGISKSFGLSFAKAQMAAGEALPMAGTAFLSVNDRDHDNIVPVARSLAKLRFRLAATRGTAATLEAAGLTVRTIPKVSEGRPNALDLIANREIDLVIATPLGKSSRADETEIRRACGRRGIPFISTLSAAAATVLGIQAMSDSGLDVKSLQEIHEGAAPPVAQGGVPGLGLAAATLASLTSR